MVHRYLKLHNKNELNIGTLIMCSLKLSTRSHKEERTSRASAKYNKFKQKQAFFANTKNIFVNAFNVELL